MHQRIDTVLQQFQQDVSRHLDKAAINEICARVGHVWRECQLTPFAIVHWFLLHVLRGNTALEHVSVMARRSFTSEAYCEARSRLPLAVFKAVLRNLIAALVPRTETGGLWHGHRTFLVDGSSFSMPDTPALQKQFGQPSNQKRGCGFPVARILALFHAGTGFLLEVTAARLNTHEMSQIDGIRPTLKRGDVLVGDRGFCSFAHLALLIGRGVHAVFRLHQRVIVDFTPGRPHADPGVRKAAGTPRSRWLRSLGVFDQVVEWLKPEQRPDWMTAEQYAALPGTITVRELRYTITRRGFRTRVVTLVTTLLDPELYPSKALADLYFARWRVEQNLKDLKQTMKMDVLRCKSVDGVLKELNVYAMVYNLVRLVIGEAAQRQGVDVDRVSFVDALRWLMEAKPNDALIRLVVNPLRPGRYEPRVRKRRPKEYPLMKAPRHELRKRLLQQQLAA